MFKVVVRAPEIRTAGIYTSLPAEKRISVEANTWAEVIAAVEKAGCDSHKIVAHGIDQPDCVMKDGVAVSPMFEKLANTLP